MDTTGFPFYDMPVPFLILAAFLLANLALGLIILIIQTGQRLTNTDPMPLSKTLVIAVNQLTDGVVVMLLLYWLKINPYAAVGAGFIVLISSGLLSMKLFLRKDWNTTTRLWSMVSVMEVVLLPLLAIAFLSAWMYFCQNIYPMILNIE